MRSSCRSRQARHHEQGEPFENTGWQAPASPAQKMPPITKMPPIAPERRAWMSRLCNGPTSNVTKDADDAAGNEQQAEYEACGADGIRWSSLKFSQASPNGDGNDYA
jgi:hypothetical protein